MTKALACLPMLALLLTASAFAADAPGAATAKAPAATAPVPKETKSVTQGSVTINGQAIKYTATAGTLILRDAKNEPTASMFYVAYTRDGADAKTRPLTFVYNGGPGSSSIWLEMGAFGPVRVEVSDAQATPPPPYGIVPNQYSLLDKSDLVFIDMVGSGYSRLVGKGEGKDFWGVDQDVASFGQFIQRYITANNRWNSPKYLLGESYGTTRSANLADWLQQNGVALNGVVLQSTILNYGDTMPGTDLEYITYLPSYAAIAWYHNKLPNKPAELAPFLEQVRAFARGEYADALFQGSKLPQSEYNDVLAKLVQYTGLSAQFLKNANLKVSPTQFRAELLRDEDRILGRYDARYEGINSDNAQAFPEYDPSDTGIGPAYTAAWNWYVKNRLRYETTETYRVTGYNIIGPWDWKHPLPGRRSFFTPPLPDVAANLGDAMRKNPHLKVFSANGYYDLATPFFKTEFDLDQLDLPPAIYKNIQFYYYPSGHMLYLHVPTLAKYKADLAKWYDETDNH
ncbi:MAG: peptidase S10 [Gammaproteobacteria bacterium]|nr:peptidase S10 [Gammaproteobacteria bacterium]MDE1887493.1 peptidase S10 [Gammaproteobacteria bacterium]MDE2024448.1 peptidase S10 [Gammaproteobacteria bacterium]MDE2273710.1 peptidase S10 [Gammaproteobacteria bacterium]